MRVSIGNNRAISSSYDDEGKLVLSPHPGEHVTNISFPKGMAVKDAFVNAIAALKRHMEPGATPVWIESDDKQLRKLLVDYYGLQITKANRPEGWGEGNAS